MTPKEKAKEMENLTKCYCGHTTTCDCGPETLEEVAQKYYNNYNKRKEEFAFIDGAKWQQERSYSEEEVIYLLNSLQNHYSIHNEIIYVDKWFEQHKNK